jgi:uncharacterized delta-60 repeat protein
MSATSWLRRWTTRLARPTSPIQRPRSRRSTVRPQLEALESRHVPAPVVAANLAAYGGTLDPTFGTNGVATPNATAPGDYAFDPAQLADGRIVTPISANGSMTVVGFRRFLADGSPDPTFGPNHDGRVALPASSVFADYSLQGPSPTSAAYALQGDKIVMAEQNGPNVTLTRLNADGSPDTMFGTHLVCTDIDGMIRMTVLPSNLILLVGGTDRLAGGPQAGMAFVRCTADGVLDPTFNSVSGAEVRTTTPFNSPEAILVQGDGRIVVGDATSGSETSNFAVGRFNADGALDTNFGYDAATGQSTGWNDQVYFLPIAEVGDDPLSALAVDPRNGGIIAVGNYGIVRYTSDGRLDSSFGPQQGGVVSYLGVAASIDDPEVVLAGVKYEGDLGLGLGTTGSYAPLPAGAAIQSDGSIIIGGPNQNAVRLNPDGDTTFGQGGVLPSAAQGNSNGMLVQGGSATLVGNNNGVITLVRFSTPLPPTAVAGGQAFTLAASATDPNPADLAAGFTYQVDWGDGSPTATVEPTPYNGGITLTHSFAAAPAATTDTIRVTVTDANDAQTFFPLTITVEPITTAGLQAVLGGGLPVDPTTGRPAVVLAANNTTDADAVITAVNHLQAPSAPAAVILDLGTGTFADINASPPPGVTLVINGNGSQMVIGNSPALTVGSGDVVVTGVTLTTTTNSPTILVTGGHLTLRNDVIQESNGYSQAAVQITGGTVDLGTTTDPGGNTVNINGAGSFVRNATSVGIPTAGDAFAVNGAPVVPSNLSGIVWEDFNDDGGVDFGESGIHGVTITLTGTDYLGDPVSLSQSTDGDGAYVFDLLLPGNYTVTETQPTGYLQGSGTPGTAGGSLSATDQFLIPLAPGVNGLNYNFGEQPGSTGPVQKGQAAGIGFWNNKNGQALIKSFNGGGLGTELADWLAATMPNTFGISAAGNNLTGKSNAYVANLFQQDFVLKGVKLDAQVLATALNVYATNATLDSTRAAAQYGFTVNGDGVGAAGVNVASDGSAFGVANNSTMTVLDLLKATDAHSINGLLFGGNASKRNLANDLFSAINQAGGI